MLLFLVLDEVKLDYVASDVLISQTKLLKRTYKVYEEMKVKGKLKISYAFADYPGVVTIWDVGSTEELQQILFLLPSMPLVNRTVKPLTEMKSLMHVIEQLESLIEAMPK
jgi:muconolactone D-isomerase